MLLEKRLELRPHLRVLESQFDRRLEIAELVATIVAPALECVGDDPFFRQQQCEAVGQLNLAPGAGWHRAEVMKYARRKDIAPDHRQRRWRRSGLGLLDHAADATDAPARRVGIGLDDAPAADLRGRHVHDADRRCALAPRDVHHLLGHRNFRIDQVVGEQHRERFVADHRLRAKDRVPQPERLGLADVNAIDARGHGGLHHLEQRMLVPRGELGLQLIRFVEVVLDRALVSAR